MAKQINQKMKALVKGFIELGQVIDDIDSLGPLEDQANLLRLEKIKLEEERDAAHAETTKAEIELDTVKATIDALNADAEVIIRAGEEEAHRIKQEAEAKAKDIVGAAREDHKEWQDKINAVKKEVIAANNALKDEEKKLADIRAAIAKITG